MLQVFAVPHPLSQWLDGAVIIRMGADQHESRFPAMPRAMLTMHLTRTATNAPWSIAQAATFHTLTTEPTAYTHAGGITALGLIVRPAAAVCLLQLACSGATNTALPWSDVAGQAEAARLAEQLSPLDNEWACLRALTASFGRAMEGVAAEQRQQTEQLCEAVGRLGAQAGVALGIGRRQLERRCRSVLGMSPKHFERLERFHRALTAVVTQDDASLAQESIDAGYYDQSHLALDARELGGPSVLALKSQAQAHTPWWALSTPRALQACSDPLKP
ncbi:MAG: helix-turn-helix domain-containing protein [Hydrogenophaga sp.]|nr:helix-turn-helix domain-containing protein [Hydrogenophaga sp.]